MLTESVCTHAFCIYREVPNSTFSETRAYVKSPVFTYLRFGIHGSETTSSIHVPYTDVSVCCTTTARQHIRLPWTPGQRLNESKKDMHRFSVFIPGILKVFREHVLITRT